MRTWTVRLGLSLMVVVGFWMSRLPAQEVLLVPVVPYEPAQHGPSASPLTPRPLPKPADHLARRLLNSHGMGCANDRYYPTCGNLHYELRFIFGSCRSFFDQPCAPGQLCGDKRSPR